MVHGRHSGLPARCLGNTRAHVETTHSLHFAIGSLAPGFLCIRHARSLQPIYAMARAANAAMRQFVVAVGAPIYRRSTGLTNQHKQLI